MNILRSLNIAFASISIVAAGGSVALAADHRDAPAIAQDLTDIYDSRLIVDIMAGLKAPGVGDQEEGFAGVAADLDLDLTYGRNVVAPIVSNNQRR